MSYFEDQEDAWLENDCKGRIEDYNPFDPDSWPRQHATVESVPSSPKRTKSQKRNDQRKRAKARKREVAA
jgi:hypothetical protein